MVLFHKNRASIMRAITGKKDKGFLQQRNGIKHVTVIFTVLMALILPTIVYTQTAVDAVTPGKFVVELPTLICVGFEWYIEGDNNRNSSVEVSYRESGTSEWLKALPLLRLNGEKVVFDPVAINYVAPNMFAGSIFNLKPYTEYECRFVLKDPDGVRGQASKTVTVTTRQEPADYKGDRILHVYPPDYEGEKEEPSFTGLMEAYYGPGKGLWGSATVKPGDVILIHAGV